MRCILALLLLAACAPTIPYEDGTITVSFCQQDDCERALLEQLHGDVVCAFYDLDLPSVERALENATVLVFDENAGTFPPVSSRGLMHHKFCVVNGSTVVTGSTNPTENGVRKNDNNMLVIRSRVLADAYLAEFADLGKEKARHGTAVNLSGSLVRILFCPQGPCEEAIVREIGKAQHTIRFMLFTFTSDAVGDALLDAHSRGVSVEGVIEKRQNSRWSEHHRLREWSVPVLFDGNPWTMHHKVLVIDNETVITGSYNPTASASERNDENLLIIQDDAIARQYVGEFGRVWREAALASQE